MTDTLRAAYNQAVDRKAAAHGETTSGTDAIANLEAGESVLAAPTRDATTESMLAMFSGTDIDLDEFFTLVKIAVAATHERIDHGDSVENIIIDTIVTGLLTGVFHERDRAVRERDVDSRVARGIEAYRTELEDHEQHPEDALRIALRVAIGG